MSKIQPVVTEIQPVVTKIQPVVTRFPDADNIGSTV